MLDITIDDRLRLVFCARRRACVQQVDQEFGGFVGFELKGLGFCSGFLFRHGVEFYRKYTERKVI